MERHHPHPPQPHARQHLNLPVSLVPVPPPPRDHVPTPALDPTPAESRGMPRRNVFRSARLTQTVPIQHRYRQLPPSRTPLPRDSPTVISDTPTLTMTLRISGEGATTSGDPPPPRPHPPYNNSRMRTRRPWHSKRASRRARGPSKPGWRSRRRKHFGSFNVRGLRVPHKFELLAQEFKNRRFFCAGASEVWLSGQGTVHDPSTGARLLYSGLPEEENSAQGKWGVGFLLSQEACSVWKKSGSVSRMTSSRACSIRLDLNDKDGSKVGVYLVHGHAPQQSCTPEEREMLTTVSWTTVLTREKKVMSFYSLLMLIAL